MDSITVELLRNSSFKKACHRALDRTVAQVRAEFPHYCTRQIAEHLHCTYWEIKWSLRRQGVWLPRGRKA